MAAAGRASSTRCAWRRCTARVRHRDRLRRRLPGREDAAVFGSAGCSFQLLALLPLAVPGLVLGLGYIFFFNAPSNPFNFIYGTMSILVICSVAHFYSVAHLTAVTALKQIDQEFETVSASLRVPFCRTFLRVTLPVCLPAVLDIAIYLFVNAHDDGLGGRLPLLAATRRSPRSPCSTWTTPATWRRPPPWR